MTEEGMADKEIARKWVDSFYDPAVKLTRHSLEYACLAGLKAGRPKWHDLRKDPNDLPVRRCIDNDGNVVRLFHNSWDKKLTWYRYDFHECEWWQMETEPIAWCEIPEYTEE